MARPTALVLSGGASLGSTQVGMLRAAYEHGFVPDLVVGTSVGAINGVVVASHGLDAAGRLEEIWCRVDRTSVFPEGIVQRALLLARTRRHLFSDRALRRLIDDNLLFAKFDELPLPLGVVATDVQSGHPVLLTDGPLEPALLASAAIPGLFPRVRHEGRELTDGGLVAQVPIRQAVAMGAKSVLVLDAGQACLERRPPAHLAETLAYAAGIMLRNQVARDVRAVARKALVVHVPPLCVEVSPFDFSHTGRLIEEGYQIARRFLGELEVADSGLFGGPYRHEPTTDSIVQRAHLNHW